MGQVILDNEHEVKRVFGDSFAVYWPFIEAELDRIQPMWERWWTKESLYNGIINGRFQLWGAGTKQVVHIMIVTQVAEYPAGSILQGVMAFGQKLDENLHTIVASMENFARQMGCTSFEIHGREGWVRKLRSIKPARVTVIASFDISHGRVN